MDSMIKFIDVHKQLGERKVLDGLNIDVFRGETMVIIGRSGTGKSIMLRHIMGLMLPDSGHVIVDGVDVATASRRTLLTLRTKMGVLFQSGALIHWLTIGGNVALPLREVGGYDETQIRRIVKEKLDLVELPNAENLLPEQMSGGMQKRAALARAIVRDPEIILYDEPTSGLDPVIANTIDELIRSIEQKLGVTSVVVTHDMESAYRVGDRIAMLHRGSIIQVGTSSEIRETSDPVVRQFIEGKTEGPLKEEVPGKV